MDAATKKTKFKHICRLCNIRCINPRDQAIHYVSPVHKFMMGVKNTQLSYVDTSKTLSEQIVDTGKKDTFIGLEYIYEYAEDSNGSRMYECKLCDAPFNPDAIYLHIVGIQHRIAYLVKHHPIMGIWAGYEIQSQANYRRLTSSSLAIEQTYGRKKINVVNEVYVPKPNKCDESDSEPASDAGSNKADQQNQTVSKKTRKKRREQELARNDANFGSLNREKDNAQSMQLQSHRDGPRFQLLDDDFDARALHRPSNPRQDRIDNADFQGLGGGRDAQSRYHDMGSAYQSDNRDMPKFLHGAFGGPAMPYGTQMLPDSRVDQRFIDSVPPYPPPGGSTFQLAGRGPPIPQGGMEDVDLRGVNSGGTSYPLERPFQPAALPPVGAVLQLTGIAGLASPDEFEDVDLRRVNSDRGGPAALRDSDRHRRRQRSPDSRRRRSRFDEGCGDVDVRSVLPTGGISFRELKAAHEGNPQEGFSSAHLPLCKKKTEKETDSDMEVCSMEFSDCDPEDFWCNEELFDYMRTYQIRDEAGVHYVMDAVKMMSDALARHRAKKEGLQKWILEEKQKLEKEKKEFFEIKKRKEKSIFATHLSCSEPKMIKLFQEATGTDITALDVTGGLKPQDNKGSTKEKVTQPPHKTPVSGPAPKVQPAVKKPQVEKRFEPTPLTGFQKALVEGSVPAFPKPEAKPSQPASLSNKALVSGLGPVLQQLFLKPQDSANSSNQNPGSRFDNRGPGSTQTRSSRFDVGPVSGTKSVSRQGSNQNRVSRFDIKGPGDRTESVSGPGSDTRFSQNPRTPASKYDPEFSMDSETTSMGQGEGQYLESDINFYEDQFGGSWADNGAPLEKKKPPISAGPETRFGQMAQSSGSRFDNPNPSKESKPLAGQAAGAYFSQNQQTSGSRFDNPTPSKELKPLMGQAAGGYSDPDAKYKPMPWSSGGQTGGQGMYKETPSTATGTGSGRYGEQYTQNQWQSQYNSRGGYGSGPQSQQPTGSSGFSSDKPQGTWSSQEPTKSSAYPKSILKNRTGNPP
ncbi:uncharacterized protein RB166_014350 [Leptodactylus fuscus]|uniref:uncharacterized protein LOC142214278 n=1 Tax=Leptodactylus fuscus TaxID=238119 RepID=UPI003F4F1FCD